MYTVFMLNELIEFIPAQNRLININNENQTVTFSTSCSRCLERLLSQNDIVTQQELFDYAWGDKSPTITPNNLYQNISLIRRALKNVSGSDEWVMTVPRKGFTFDSEVKIFRQERVDSYSASATETVIAQAGEEGPASFKAPFSSSLLSAIPQRFRSVLLYVLTFALSITLILIVNDTLIAGDNIAATFVFARQIGDCKLFFNNDMREFNTHEKVLAIMQPDCKKFPYIYIYAYKVSHSASMFACDIPINEKKPHCFSRLLKGFNPL